MAKKIKNQVREILEDSAARLEGLKGRGLKVADDVAARGRDVAEQVKARVNQEAARGQKAIERLLSDATPKDLLDRFGSMKVTELIEKIKAADLAHQTEALRDDLLAALHIPTAETVARMQVSIDKLAKEVAALRALKTEVSRLSDQVKKAAAKPAPKAAPAAKAEPKAPAAKPKAKAAAAKPKAGKKG
jgi:hypothetical protein